MRKIMFLALHLGYGGAEKAIISEANILAERYSVEIVCAYKLYDEPAFPVDERVKIRYLSEHLRPNKEELQKAIKEKNVAGILKEGLKSVQVLYYRKAAMKKAIRNSDADIIISTRYLYHKLLSDNKKKGVITIAQEHNHHDGDEKYIKKMVDSVQNMDYFMPVSKELTEFYSKHLIQTKCKYIPHTLDEIPNEVSELKAPILISVGRLSPEKGHLDLIKVYAMVEKEFPDWKLHIIGDGDERKKIETSIEEHNLTGKVILHGYRDKRYINQLLSKSSVFVMTSYKEAFGIVLIEAQSFGVPALAFDSAKGALEIIENEKSGYLVSDRNLEKMSSLIKHLISDYELRKKMGACARENSLQYSKDNVKKYWYEFVDTI